MLALVDESADLPGSCMFGRLQAAHRSVAYLDRYCGALDDNIPTSELQKLGGACVVLALHMKDPNVIPLSSYEWGCYYTDGAVAVDEMVKAAKDIYNTLSAATGKRPDLEGDASFVYASLLQQPFAVSGCDLDNKSRLWPTCEEMKISRDDDDLCLLVCMNMLKTIKKDHDTSTTFFLTHYLLELAMQVRMHVVCVARCLTLRTQSQFVLKYDGATLAAAAFVFSCHTLTWNFSFWGPCLLKVVEDRSLTPATVYNCIIDLCVDDDKSMRVRSDTCVCRWRLYNKSQQLILKSNKKDASGKKKQIPHMIVKYCKRECQRVASLLPADTLPPRWWM